jgi:hypothetical protein
MKRILVPTVVALLLVAGLLAQAAEPTELPSPLQGQSAKLATATGFAKSSETTISGLVVDKSGERLVDVAVKLYMGGLLTSETTTSSDGTFEITELVDYGSDVTIDLWFVPGDPALVMENVILKESTAAIQHSLYSKCVKRVRLDPITDVVVKLLDLKSRLERIKDSDCVS